METLGCIRQFFPMETLFPIKTLGWIIVPISILAESEILLLELINGLKCFDILLKSAKGSSEINKDFPSGQGTSLFIRIVVALEFKALS